MSAPVDVTRSISAQQLPASRHSQRARSVPTSSERRHEHARSIDFEALPRPRHAVSTAAEAAASHRALDAPVLAIEGARTHAPAISTGVAAVFPAFQHAQPAVSCTRAPRRARRTACRTSICHASARMLNTNTQKSTAVIHENSGGHPEMGVVQTAGAGGFESRLAPRLFFGLPRCPS